MQEDSACCRQKNTILSPSEDFILASVSLEPLEMKVSPTFRLSIVVVFAAAIMDIKVILLFIDAIPDTKIL